jgi:hypothetical protein
MAWYDPGVAKPRKMVADAVQFLRFTLLPAQPWWAPVSIIMGLGLLPIFHAIFGWLPPMVAWAIPTIAFILLLVYAGVRLQRQVAVATETAPQVAGIIVSNSPGAVVTGNMVTTNVGPSQVLAHDRAPDKQPTAVSLPAEVQGKVPPIVDRLYEDQEIYGPAVVVLLDDFILEGNRFDGSLSQVVIDLPAGANRVGVIGVRGGFRRCNLHGIALALNAEQRRAFEKGTQEA